MRNKIILSIFLIVVLTVISFSSSLDNDFTNWDDQVYVTENPLIKDLFNGQGQLKFSLPHRIIIVL